MAHRIFLLSPGSLAGRRAQRLFDPDADLALARSLRGPEGSSLGDVFSFTSSLYFRGKRTYALAFRAPPEGLAPAYVITTTRGLLPLEIRVRLEALRELAEGTVDLQVPAYREPLVRTAAALSARAGKACQAVLLGSIASDKYLQPLLESWGRRLYIPAAFIGRGDMSRGGLMLRCVEGGTELEYVVASEAPRRGPRLARLPPRRGGSTPTMQPPDEGGR